MTAVRQRVRVDVLGTSGVIVTSDPGHLAEATSIALGEIDLVDRACSRFRPDSDLSRVNAGGGRAVAASPVLVAAMHLALRAAEVTGGDVDPTVGRALRLLGYDRDFATLDLNGPPVLSVAVAARWREIDVDGEALTVRVPKGVELDLGATAKAFAADRAAGAAAAATGGGVLVSLGGDVAVAGSPPADGWPVRVADRHSAAPSAPGPTIAVFAGGLATSGTAARRWRRGGVECHHLVDPRTGRSVDEVWRTVSVAAASCADANIASTAAIIRGNRAVEWLVGLGVAARLVAPDGNETLVGGWGGAADAGIGRH